MDLALPRPVSDVARATASTRTGLLSHIDAVYAFALTLAGDAESAAGVTERVYVDVPDDLWSTLGGHNLKDRLLARCFAIFTQALGRRERDARAGGAPGRGTLVAMLRDLPLDQRAAVALVDQLSLSYGAAAAVLGTNIAELRAQLHRGRAVLLAATRAAR